jgi:hypothetical protein
MRELLTDEKVRADCSMYQPYPESQLLNDLSTEQSLRFKPGSKMNTYLRTVSGSRPESILAQATSISGVRNTQVAEDLAMRLRYVQEKGVDPMKLDQVIGSLAARAEEEQAQAQATVVQQVNSGVPLDQATQTVESGLQQEEEHDAILSEELAYVEQNEKDDPPQRSAMTEGLDLMDALDLMSRQSLMSYYSRVKQPGALPASHFRRGGYTKGDIMLAIIDQKPDITADDVRRHHSLMNNAASLRAGLIHEHNHPIRSASERARATSERASAASESSSGESGYETAPAMTMDAAMVIEQYRQGGHRTAGGDRAVEQFERTGTYVSDEEQRRQARTAAAGSSTEYETAEEQIEETQTHRARTAAARFDERHHIPEWVNAFSNMIRGERNAEGIARREGEL